MKPWKRPTLIALASAVLASLMLPSAALAAGADQITPDQLQYNLNSLWIFIAAVLVLFMQAGFAFLEIGFSRGKNVGTVIAKILTNMGIAFVVFWAIGYSLAFSEGNSLIGGLDFAFSSNTGPGGNYSDSAFWIYQFAFVAVSMAILWGTTLERIKFSCYILFGLVFAGIIYPMVAHWTWASTGWLYTMGVQDYAGSGVVHLCGASAGLAATLVLGARKGKFVDGRPQPIPGHSMPWFGLACIILLVGWFGFNPGSGFAADPRVAEVAVVTLAGGLAGVIGALLTTVALQKTIDIGMVGNGLIAGLVAITAPSGYVVPWAALLIGLVGGVIVVSGVLAFERMRIDDPVGALSAHGLAGIWGVLACGFFAAPALVLEGQTKGLVYGGGLSQLWTQVVATIATFVFVFGVSYVAFRLIKTTIGIRVSEAEEEAGLDISEHGMYGYPEQFIPASELIGSGLPGTASHASNVFSKSLSSTQRPGAEGAVGGES